eukprot:754853-Hanusia_phi.AAC.2
MITRARASSARSGQPGTVTQSDSRHTPGLASSEVRFQQKFHRRLFVPNRPRLCKLCVEICPVFNVSRIGPN